MIFNLSSIVAFIALITPIFKSQRGFEESFGFDENINIINLALNGLVISSEEKYYNPIPLIFMILSILSIFWIINLLREVHIGHHPNTVMWFGFIAGVLSTFALVASVDALIEYNEGRITGEIDNSNHLSFNYGFYILVLYSILLYLGSFYALMNRFERFHPKVEGVREKNDDFRKFSEEYLEERT